MSLTSGRSLPGSLPEVMERLELLVKDIQALQSKLVLLIGTTGAGKSALLRHLATRRCTRVLNVGAELGKRLAALPIRDRRLQAKEILSSLAAESASEDLLLLDNLELLFDQTLRLDPLDLLKRYAHAQRVVAVWPGEICRGRLTYAEMGHPEYKDYNLEGLVAFPLEMG
ncbi:MAG: BREX-3 system P-loop-containing protein BrxF [Desulfuromonadales bacterium]